MVEVITIPAFGDNFIYVCKYAGDCAFAVDPCDSKAVLEILNQNNLQLKEILLTHHHFDHTAGVSELKGKTGCKVYSPDRQITGIDQLVSDGDVVQLSDFQAEVIATPGHTTTSVCYYLSPTKNNKAAVFTGDTMFVGGCGRVLESDFKTMYQSLMRLAALPPDTLVYCGHDYTIENYQFALTIEPGNEKVLKRLNEVKKALKEGKQTVPSTIRIEKETNIFLSSDDPEVKKALGMESSDAAAVFTKLRCRKDVF